MLTQNAKLKKTSKLHKCKILGFNLPPVKTCPYAGECKKYCYAKKCMARCNKQMQDNLVATKRLDFIQRMGEELLTKRPTHVRIHPSGDFYSKAYFLKWVRLAKLFPEITFYAYTKSIPFVNFTGLPRNLVLMFSYGGKRDDLILDSDRHCIVVDCLLEVPAGYVIGNDDDFQMMRHSKIAFIKH